ncbi:hypothetical protein GQR60_04215 [Labilibaculum sp. A4]|uniref:hypothetical protein n=1 Tax=Labilibaculum euxinus TaxID=2686357 RepID=UPI000F61889E|nr:hypothetical protein [Labilibaculum euxinus]MDQ1772046.1 hypothetical protein [Labilibaculum euxinus]MWN75541.1 hypothetical protein [Labilibaculum euxinus]
MKLKLILLNLGLFFCINLNAQKRTLYCLQGQYDGTERAMSEFLYFNDKYPKMDADQQIKYGVRLSKIDNEKLIVVDTLVKTGFMTPYPLDSVKNRTKMIRIYQEQKLFRIMYDQFDSDTTYFIEGVFKNKLGLRQFNTPNNIGLRSLNLVKEGKSYFFYRTYDNDNRMHCYNVDVEEQKEYKTTSNDYNFYRSEGYNGLGLDDTYSRINSNYTEKIELRRELVNGDTLIVTSTGKAPFDLPHYEQIIQLDSTKRNLSSKYGRMLYMICTNEMIVMPYKGKFIGDKFERLHFLYNKEKEEWKSVGLPTVFQTLRAHGKWLAGHEVFWVSAGQEERINNGVEIPGKKYRRKDTTMWGMNADTRFSIQEIFPTGKLFIYNIDTEQYFEWDAKQNNENQADSEILLIEDNKIYYRVNDAIYVRDIISGKQLGERALLVQEQTIPYVHWLFFVYE